MNKLVRYTLTFVAWSAFSSLFAQTGITFTFANGQVVGSYYEFDVMAQASAGGTNIGDNQVYINYNNNAFGPNIQTNNNIIVSLGTLMQGGLYEIVNVEDNSSSTVAITNNLLADILGFGNPLPTSPAQLLHIQILIDEPSENAGLSFQEPLMDGQEYQDNLTLYSPVIANSTDDTSLPVELTGFSAGTANGKVIINWETESELNNLGFEIYRSFQNEAEYIQIASYRTNPDLNGQGNTSNRHEYSYMDESAEPETTYWYKLADLDYSGVRTFHQPISVTTPKALPTEFLLHANYPNPFNPSTTIRFDIAKTHSELVKTSIVIYNTLGQVTKRLYQDNLVAGSYEVLWDGTTDAGNSAPSSVYFVVFRAGQFSQTQKILLIK